MSGKERELLKVFADVKKRRLRIKQAAELVALSYRQCRRRYQRYRQEGAAGLVHRGRGQASNRGHGEDIKKAVLARYEERYPDFGPTLAAEKLELDGYRVNHETLREWLIGARLWKKRRKRSPHRSWREPRRHFGELLQMDGSFHQWFEDRGGESCLMNLVDDATGTTLSLLSEEETTFAAMEHRL